jgi:hypothetical protein
MHPPLMETRSSISEKIKRNLGLERNSYRRLPFDESMCAIATRTASTKSSALICRDEAGVRVREGALPRTFAQVAVSALWQAIAVVEAEREVCVTFVEN